MSAWSYIYDGTPGDFAVSKLANPSLTRQSGGDDKLTFVGPGHDPLGSPLFAYGKEIILLHEGMPAFTGRVTTIPRSGAAGTEQIAWEIVGPWFYLAQTTYMQSVQIWDPAADDGDGGTGAVVMAYQSRVVLGRPAAGAGRLNSGQVLTEVLQYCQTVNPGKFGIGTISPAVTMPFEEVLDASCAEIIQRLMRWSPDCVIYFDYSTAIPTINIKARSAMTVVAIPAAGDPVATLHIVSREDMIPACVAIRYEITTIVDGVEHRSHSTDIAPLGFTGRELNAINFTIELSGGRGTIQRQELGTEPHNIANKAWWVARIAWLGTLVDADWNIDFADIAYAGLGAIPALANEILIGSVPDWTNKYVRSALITIEISYAKKNAEGAVVEEWLNKRLEYRCKVTNAEGTITEPSGDPGEADPADRRRGQMFTHMVVEEYPEPIPTGLAAEFFASLSALQYEGEIVLSRPECLLTDPSVGQCLSLTGGPAAWGTARMVLQRSVMALDRGETRMAFGPLPASQISDMLELFRTNRRRSVPMAGFKRDDATQLYGRSDVDIRDQNAPQVANGLGPGEPRLFRIQARDGGGIVTQEIVADPSDFDTDYKVFSAVSAGGVRSVRADWLRFHA